MSNTEYCNMVRPLYVLRISYAYKLHAYKQTCSEILALYATKLFSSINIFPFKYLLSRLLAKQDGKAFEYSVKAPKQNCAMLSLSWWLQSEWIMMLMRTLRTLSLKTVYCFHAQLTEFSKFFLNHFVWFTRGLYWTTRPWVSKSKLKQIFMGTRVNQRAANGST